MASSEEKYNRLFALSREITTLQSVSYLLHWDQETHMPPSGAGARAEQLELMAQLIHKRRTSKAFEKALNDLQEDSLTGPRAAALREWRRDFLLATKLPAHFVKKSTVVCAQAVEVWRQARADSDFSRFAPHLEQIVDLWREKAELLGYEDHPYDALLDEYEPDSKAREISKLFGRLRNPLATFRQEALALKAPRTDFLFKRYPKEKQLCFSHVLLETTGFTKERGALDLTTHPFCMALHPTDGRVTTRINEHDPMENFLATLHEGGHYLYEVSLPEEVWGSPLGTAASTAVHESQSRWWETLVGQSLPFWRYAFPKLKKLFPHQLDGVGVTSFYKAVNALRPTPIRIEADEVSYCLHVILRFELEKALVEGSLAVHNLPDAWNAGMSELLGITPETDALGCLQDVHWASGFCGYFPTYALGNLYAAQLFETYSKQHPHWDKQIEKGEFAPMRDWLHHNIHQHGRRYHPTELIRRVTGRKPSIEPYLTYLRNKYL